MGKLSKHAEVRMQQRGISRGLVAFLSFYGQEVYDSKATVLRLPNRKERLIIASELRHIVEYLESEKRNPALVEGSDGTVITVEHLERKRRRGPQRRIPCKRRRA